MENANVLVCTNRMVNIKAGDLFYIWRPKVPIYSGLIQFEATASSTTVYPKNDVLAPSEIFGSGT